MNQPEKRIAHWLAAHNLPFLRGGLGIVYLWFGALKFNPGMSPAQGLAVQTIDVLTMGLIPPEVRLVLLAALECAIEFGFLTGKYMRTTLVLMAVQMTGTLTPLVMFPETVFTTGLYALTLEGQYIIKNVVLIGVGLVLVQPCVAGVSSLNQRESETNVHEAVTRDTGSGSGVSLLAAAEQRDDELAS